MPHNRLLTSLVTLNDALQKANDNVTSAEDAVTAAETKLDEFLSEHHCSYGDFVDLGIEVAKPVIDEYKRLFISADGDYTTMVKACMAARVLNPFKAKEMTYDV